MEIRPEHKITIAYMLPVICAGLSLIGAGLKIAHVKYEKKKLERMRGDETRRFKYLLLTLQRRRDNRQEDYMTLDGVPMFFPLAIGLFMMYIQVIYLGVARQVLSPYDCVRGECPPLRVWPASLTVPSVRRFVPPSTTCRAMCRVPPLVLLSCLAPPGTPSFVIPSPSPRLAFAAASQTP